MTLEESRQQYVEKRKEIDKIEDRINMRRAQIDRLLRKKDKRWEGALWTDNLIRPIMELVKAKFPDVVWDDERLVTMGLRSNVYVFGEMDGKTVASICFTPYDLDNGILAYDTGEKEGSYQEGSIGAMNGFDNITKPIEDIQEIYDLVEKKIKFNLELSN